MIEELHFIPLRIHEGVLPGEGAGTEDLYFLVNLLRCFFSSPPYTEHISYLTRRKYEGFIVLTMFLPEFRKYKIDLACFCRRCSAVYRLKEQVRCRFNTLELNGPHLLARAIELF